MVARVRPFLSATWRDLMKIRNEIETYAMMINTCPYLCDPLGNTARIISRIHKRRSRPYVTETATAETFDLIQVALGQITQ